VYAVIAKHVNYCEYLHCFWKLKLQIQKIVTSYWCW